MNLMYIMFATVVCVTQIYKHCCLQLQFVRIMSFTMCTEGDLRRCFTCEAHSTELLVVLTCRSGTVKLCTFALFGIRIIIIIAVISVALYLTDKVEHAVHLPYSEY